MLNLGLSQVLAIIATGAIAYASIRVFIWLVIALADVAWGPNYGSDQRPQMLSEHEQAILIKERAAAQAEVSQLIAAGSIAVETRGDALLEDLPPIARECFETYGTFYLDEAVVGCGCLHDRREESVDVDGVRCAGCIEIGGWEYGPFLVRSDDRVYVGGWGGDGLLQLSTVYHLLLLLHEDASV